MNKEIWYGNEIWMDYIEGHYQVSSHGNIRSVDKVVLFSGTPGIRRGITLKPTLGSKGYLTVVICVNGFRNTINLHRAIAETFIRNLLDKSDVNHDNGNKLDNSIMNLEWNTSNENQQHAYDTGLNFNGSLHGRSKLTEEDIPEIRSRIAKGEGDTSIGKDFGVTRGTIRGIRDNRSWKHVL